jgi:hypothetical protein
MLKASIMLVAFASRALVPPGFMPASDRPFSIYSVEKLFSYA